MIELGGRRRRRGKGKGGGGGRKDVRGSLHHGPINHSTNHSIDRPIDPPLVRQSFPPAFRPFFTCMGVLATTAVVSALKALQNSIMLSPSGPSACEHWSGSR